MTATAPLASQYQLEIRRDPVRWIREALGVNLWGPQEDVARAVMNSSYWKSVNPDFSVGAEKIEKDDNEWGLNGGVQKVAWRTGHAVGKSFATAAIALARVHAFSPGYVITTGASWNGVKKILWPAIRKMIREAPVDLFPGISPLDTELKLGDGWGIFGVSTNEVENFAGFHEVNGPLVLIDEASALEYDLYESILGLCSTANSAILAVGNPIIPDGPFRDMFDDPEFECFHSSSLDTPNVKENKTIIPGLCEREYIESMKITYGEKSAVFQSRVLGNFPRSAEDSLITMEMVEESKNRYDDKKAIDTPTLRLGVDVARFGGDRTVLLIRDRFSVIHIERFVGQDLMATCGRVRQLVEEWGIDPVEIYVDDTGVGGGVVDRLREMNYDAQPVNNGEGALDNERFANIRAETYWMMREAIADHFAIPPEFDELGKELVAPRYKLLSSGKIQLEEKSEIKKRLQRSPDLADALALTFASGGTVLEYI